MRVINSIFKTFLISMLLAAQVHFAYAQTAALLPVAPQQFFDKNGNPVSSGSVGYYVPGTSTLKMIWQDDSQSIPWSNPIILNAGGWPPNNKGIYGNGTYRQIIKDKNGNIISDQPTSAIGTGGGGGTLVGDGNPVGTISTWPGMLAPNQYQFAYGQALSRNTYQELFQAITLLTGATCVGGNTTLTGISDTSNIPVGANVEGNCIATNSTVVSKTINTVTLSIAAVISTSASIRFYPYGNGDGNNTFNVPDLRGKVIPGRTNMGGVTATNLTNTYYGSNPDAVGANGGTQSFTMALANLIEHDHTVFLRDPGHRHNFSNWPGGNVAVNFAGTTVNLAYGTQTTQQTVDSTTGITLWSDGPNIGNQNKTGKVGSNPPTPMPLIQPSLTLNYIIKVTPDTSVSGLFGVASIGGMQGIIACGSGLTCAGNVISAAGSVAGGADTQVQYNSSGGFAGNAAFIWVNPKLTIGLNGTSTGQIALAGATSGSLVQTVGTIAGTPIITWGNSTGTPAVTANAPLSINTTTGNLTITGSALTKTDDTNVTLTLGGSPSTSLLAATSITVGWSGTLAAGRLNSNVVQSVVNDTNVTGSISAQALTLGWTGNLAVSRGGTGGTIASGTLLDNITGFSSTGFLIRTGAGTYTFQSTTNGITNSNLAQAGAATIKGNPTGSTANVQDFTIQGLTARGAPDAANDKMIIFDDAAGTLKYVTPAQVASSSVAGVSSIAGNTGAFTLSTGITNSTNDIRVDKASASNYFAATSNKVPTTDVIYTSEVSVTYGTTTTFDFSTFINSSVTLTGNITTMTLSNVIAGKAGSIRFIQDGTGSHTTVWNSTFKFAGGTTPSLSTAANAVDVLSYNCVTTSFCQASLMKDVK